MVERPPGTRANGNPRKGAGSNPVSRFTKNIDSKKYSGIVSQVVVMRT